MFDIGYEDYQRIPLDFYYTISKAKWLKYIEKGNKYLFVGNGNTAYILNDKGELELI